MHLSLNDPPIAVMQGNVRPTQERPKALGCSIADDEVVRKVVGECTKGAICQVQKRLGLEKKEKGSGLEVMGDRPR